MRWLWWLLWWRVPCLRETVTVSLKGQVGQPEVGLHGVLWSSRGSWLVLRQVDVQVGGESPERMKGEAIVHRSEIAFIQVFR